MPRISYPENEDRRAGDMNADPENLNLDYCRRCYDMRLYSKDIPEGILGTTWVDFDTEHPPYSGEGYECESCGDILTDDDN